jgi:dTDP-glucose 4,6-dehydratase
MQTLLITGGAGFIGSNFVRLALARTAARVVVFDSLTYAGSLESLKDVASDPRFAFVQADVTDRTAVAGALAAHRPTAIVNFAAETHVDRSIDGPRAFVTTNVVGAFELLDAARRYAADLDAASRAAFRFLHVSTDEVYGSLGPTGFFSEDTAYAPNSPYAASKAAADHLVRAYHETYGLPTLLTNCSNNYGPYQFPEKVIPFFTTQALLDLELPMYASTTNRREWIHAIDHCRAIAHRYNLYELAVFQTTVTSTICSRHPRRGRSPTGRMEILCRSFRPVWVRRGKIEGWREWVTRPEAPSSRACAIAVSRRAEARSGNTSPRLRPRAAAVAMPLAPAIHAFQPTTRRSPSSRMSPVSSASKTPPP